MKTTTLTSDFKNLLTAGVSKSILLLSAFAVYLSSCQSPNDRASRRNTDSLAMENSLKQDSMLQDSSNTNVPNKGGNVISSKAQIDDDQANFMKEAAMGSLMEIEAGRLAAGKGSNPRVRNFGTRMTTDHTQALNALKPIAQELGVLIPSALAGVHADHLKMLNDKSGGDFDQAYINMMVTDHAKTVQLFKLYTAARHPKVATYANKYLPVIEDHYEKALEIK